MEPETLASAPEAPPEALLVRTAREAVGMTAAQAAAATAGAVSATYWRDVERGYGGRRGQRAAARASARLLAAMAHVTGVTPGQLTAAEREDAARVLTEILRREGGAPAGGPALRPVAPPRAATAGSPAEAALIGLLSRYGDDEVIQAIGTQGHRESWPAWAIVQAVLRWLERQDREAVVREFLAELLRDYEDNEVVQTVARQRGKPGSMIVAEILEFVSWRPPEMREPEAGTGTAG